MIDLTFKPKRHLLLLAFSICLTVSKKNRLSFFNCLHIHKGRVGNKYGKKERSKKRRNKEETNKKHKSMKHTLFLML